MTSALLRSSLDLLLPPTCILCAAPCVDRPVPGARLCHPCHALLDDRRPRCVQCAALCASRSCSACLAKPPPFDRTIVFADYRAPLDRAIHALKYRGELSIASTLGALLIPHGLALCPELGEGALLTAVPLSPARLRERGFNQAIEIARPIGRALSRPVAAGALSRVRFAQAQARLGPGERSLNTIQAFEACHRTVSGRAVIVVDDVMTTGATLTAIARALKDAGALSVTNLVVTRTPIDHVQRRTGPP